MSRQLSSVVAVACLIAASSCLAGMPGEASPKAVPRAALPATAAKPAVILGYSASWTDAVYPPAAYDYSGLTHIARSFLAPHADGRITFGSDYWNAELEQGAHAHGVKLLASLGGAAENANEWLGMARDPAAKARFFDSLQALIDEHHYDGVDIDWEPSAFGDADQQAYSSFMVSLRQRFPSWQISTALVASDWWARHISWQEVAASVDFINLMTYTFAGPWSGHSAHNANLFAASSYSPDGVDIDGSLHGLLKKYRVPPEKVLLGLAFYGTQYSTDHMGQKFPAGSRFTGQELGYAAISRLRSAPEYSAKRDEGAHVPYLERTRGGHTVSFDDERSINEKCVYAVQQGLRGIMFWYLGGDLVRGQTVLQRAVQRTYGLPPSPATLAFLRSTYAVQVAEVQRIATELERELRDLERADAASRAVFTEPNTKPVLLAEAADQHALVAALRDVDQQLGRLEVLRAEVQRALASVPPSKGRALAFSGPSFKVADFESPALTHALAGSWSESFDKNLLGTVFNPQPLAWSGAGHESGRALHLWGHFGKSRAPWPFAALVADFEPSDFSTVSRLRFWAKGNAKKYSASLHRLAVHDYAFPAASFATTSAWAVVELPLSDFKQPAWGQKHEPSWTDVNGIAFQPAPEFDDEDFDLWLDDLELVKR